MFQNLSKKFSNPATSYWEDFLYLTLILGPILFGFLDMRPFAVPDEGRYVEIPREMLESGDYVTPRLNGLKYFEKPPLMYWIQAFFIKAFGIKEWAMRLPLALMGLMGCFMTYAVARFLFSRLAGLTSAFVLGSSLLYVVMSQLIILDMAVSFFLSASLFAFLMGVNTLPPQRRWYMYLAAVCAALSVLAKGLIGLALPGLIIFLWIALTQNWRLLGQLYLPSSILIFLSIALPWHILASVKNPEFFDFYIVHEHFTRFLTKVHRRYQPFWFFVPVLIAGFIPWTSFALKALYLAFMQGRKNPNHLFLLLWTVIPFVFFSLSSSKLIPYLLPVMTPLAILTGLHIANSITHQKSLKFEVFAFSAVCLLMMLGGIYGIQRIDLDLFRKLKTHIIMLYGVLGCAAIIPPALRLWKGNAWAFVSILISGLALIVVANFGAPNANKISIKPLAQKFKDIMPKGTKVFTYATYYYDLPVYLDQMITIYNWTNEFEFGQKAEPHKRERLTYYTEDVQQAWTSDQYACIFTKLEIYKNDLLPQPWFTPMILGQHDKQILVCNRVPESALRD